MKEYLRKASWVGGAVTGILVIHWLFGLLSPITAALGAAVAGVIALDVVQDHWNAV